MRVEWMNGPSKWSNWQEVEENELMNEFTKEKGK